MSLDQGGPNALRKKLVDFFKGKVLTMNENLCLPNKYFLLNGCFMTRRKKYLLLMFFQIIVQGRRVRSVVSLVSAESLTLTNCRHLCHQILFWGKYTWNFSSLGNKSSWILYYTEEQFKLNNRSVIGAELFKCQCLGLIVHHCIFLCKIFISIISIGWDQS